jgi:DNA helicase IV
MTQLLQEMRDRRYSAEQEAWLAWLLRFALPEESAAKDRFVGIPSALAPAPESIYGPWSHVVIDEAQDLSVAEASLLSSFVDPKGALTISADFRQIVSPVHGMVNADAFHVGSPVGRGHKPLQFPFTRNMRQTREITNFLRSFYRQSFGEVPTFDANEDFSDIKPELQIAPFSEFARRMKQRWSILQRSGKNWSVAVLQVNEDGDRMQRLRELLLKEGVPLAPVWHSSSAPDKLVNTSVERIKGLEYDICFVVGLDDIEGHSLEFFLNRAYVALSRASRRLSIFCEDFPEMLKKIDRKLFDVNK